MKFTDAINNNYRIYLFLILLSILFGYYGFSSQFNGPAYLSDEIGYLTKAIALAGYSVDMASSWHGGYAFILAPLFLFSSDPFTVWKGVLAVNAVMWTLSYYLLFHLLVTIFPEKSKCKILSAVVFVSLYPSWLIMSGYAFSTTAIVMVFMISVVALSKIEKSKWLLVHSLSVGFLYWIHPTGAAIAVVSVIVIIIISRSTKKFSAILVNVIVLSGMIVLYKFAVHPWFDTIMSPSGFTAHGHYKSFGFILDKLKTLEFYGLWLVTFCGHVSSLLISTFGLLVYVLSSSVSSFFSAERKNSLIKDRNYEIIILFCVLVTLGAAALGSMSFSTSSIYRVDLWIYGRYAEVALFPLIGSALLIKWRRSAFFMAVLFLFIASLLVHNHSIGMTNTIINLVNIQSFWPQVIYKQGHLFFWFVIGIIGVSVIYYLPRKFAILCMVILYALSIQNQAQFHKGILSHYSKPSGIVDLIYSNFSKGSIVGFDPDSKNLTMQERRNLYSFYLFPYQFQRMAPEDWILNNDGAFLTHNINNAKTLVDLGADLIGREDKSNLFLLFNRGNLGKKIIQNSYQGITLSSETNCLLNGCYLANSQTLANHTNTGEIKKDKIITNNNPGYLFFGPYGYLDEGSYLLKLDISLIDGRGSVVDIVSNKGKNHHGKFELYKWFPFGRNSIVVPFEVREQITDFEVRLRVSKESDLEVYGYSIVQNLDKNSTDYHSADLRMPASIINTTQVGKFVGKNLVTNSKSGFLAYGPYTQLPSGVYTLNVLGSAENIDKAYIDIASDRGEKVHARFELVDFISNNENTLLSEMVHLSEPVSDVEVRIWVGDNDIITLIGYTLSKNNEQDLK